MDGNDFCGEKSNLVAAFSRLTSVNLGSIFKDSDRLNLASFYHFLPYFSHQTALASGYRQGAGLTKSRIQPPSGHAPSTRRGRALGHRYDRKRRKRRFAVGLRSCPGTASALPAPGQAGSQRPLSGRLAVLPEVLLAEWFTALALASM
jgi:hypothetical protein